jgi:hypothetical protein
MWVGAGVAFAVTTLGVRIYQQITDDPAIHSADEFEMTGRSLRPVTSAVWPYEVLKSDVN